MLLVSDKTFQLQAITSSIAQVRAFDELHPVPCGQQSSSELSLLSFIQFHLPLLEFKNYCRSSCAGNLITSELDLRPRLEFFRAVEIHLQIQLSILYLSEGIQLKLSKSLPYTAILMCKHMHVICGRASDFHLYLTLSFSNSQVCSSFPSLVIFVLKSPSTSHLCAACQCYQTGPALRFFKKKRFPYLLVLVP